MKEFPITFKYYTVNTLILFLLFSRISLLLSLLWLFMIRELDFFFNFRSLLSSLLSLSSPSSLCRPFLPLRLFERLLYCCWGSILFLFGEFWFPLCRRWQESLFSCSCCSFCPKLLNFVGLFFLNRQNIYLFILCASQNEIFSPERNI